MADRNCFTDGLGLVSHDFNFARMDFSPVHPKSNPLTSLQILWNMEIDLVSLGNGIFANSARYFLEIPAGNRCLN
jgi:hypothetical protein